MTKEQIAEAVVVGAGEGAAAGDEVGRESVALRLVQDPELPIALSPLSNPDMIWCSKRELRSKSGWTAT